ncbi:NAD(P)H-binding protein [Lentzea flava]|uniref:NAD(P)-binding domain-containing protein n=1 Tax=Lentzea flava TaxID=103732 RepID=A0ABQ2VFM2_9PSEU|nr:NAD(P)H-binding protein [Lentzea flava]GGU84488.1 hypothetical protein GCM10010178_88470 [Lentzea flava]
MRIAVSGAETSVGANTIAALTERDLIAVALVSRHQEQLTWSERGTRSSLVQWCDRSSLYGAMKGCEALVLCAPSSVPIEGYLHAAARAQVSRVVLVSNVGTCVQQVHIDNEVPTMDHGCCCTRSGVSAPWWVAAAAYHHRLPDPSRRRARR